MRDLIMPGTRAWWGDVPVTVEAVSSTNGERLYLAIDDNGTVIHGSDGDFEPADADAVEPEDGEEERR
jgi:hypothetical protein